MLYICIYKLMNFTQNKFLYKKLIIDVI
jgi:hypothetical protein